MEGMSQLPSRSSDQPEELQKILKLVKERKEQSEAIQKPYRDRWDEYYGLYRNFRKLKSRLKGQAARDRDIVMAGAKREWGAELFIPYCFTVVETIVPRVISSEPRLLVHPRNENAKDSAKRVQELLDSQQREISYDRKLQTVARSGLKYGLGVQKTDWRRKTRRVLRNVPRKYLPGYATVEQEVVLFEGPYVEPVSIWDFFWSPAAIDIETSDYVIHRTWRSFEYVKSKVESGDWFPINLNAVEKMGSGAKWTETWGPRLEAAGVPQPGQGAGQSKMHEVWEYHDRENVYTVLDGEFVVGADKTPHFHRELPFQIFRPTPQEHEFPGIGEIEPIAHLQYELNTLRSQRRDNATLVLQKGFMYAEGFVDPEHLKVGPGVGIPVRGANIRDVIQELNFSDIPASSVSEENAVKEDIERTTGISDALAGGGGGGTAASETATGLQLVQNAMGVRIRLKTKNLESETVREAARQFLELNRQHVLQPQTVRVPDPSAPEGFRFEEVGPRELQDDIDFPIPDGGSTEPDNPPAKQQAALTLFNALANNPAIDQQKLTSHLLREYGVTDAPSYIVNPGSVPVDPNILAQALVQAGADPEMAMQITQMAIQASGPQPPPGEEPPPNEAPPEQ